MPDDRSISRLAGALAIAGAASLVLAATFPVFYPSPVDASLWAAPHPSARLQANAAIIVLIATPAIAGVWLLLRPEPSSFRAGSLAGVGAGAIGFIAAAAVFGSARLVPAFGLDLQAGAWLSLAASLLIAASGVIGLRIEGGRVAAWILMGAAVSAIAAGWQIPELLVVAFGALAAMALIALAYAVRETIRSGRAWVVVIGTMLLAVAWPLPAAGLPGPEEKRTFSFVDLGAPVELALGRAALPALVSLALSAAVVLIGRGMARRFGAGIVVGATLPSLATFWSAGSIGGATPHLGSWLAALAGLVLIVGAAQALAARAEGSPA